MNQYIVTTANNLSLIDARKGDFLGEVPIDPRIVEGGDAGRPILVQAPDSLATQAFQDLAEKVVRSLAVLADASPPIVDANISWVTSPN